MWAGPPGDKDDSSWPLVSVVLPTRGRPELVRASVASVVAQDYCGELEIFVVHDQEEPQAALTELARPGRTVSAIVNTHHLGLAGARNTGLDRASGDFIASCDDDDTWDRDKLGVQMARMRAEPDLMVLGAGVRLLMSPEESIDWPGNSPVVTREQLLASRRKELHSSTLLVRRAVFDEVGGYDEGLPESYAEDYEFLLRAVETGTVGVINRPLASIRKYGSSWFRERAVVVADALEYLLQRHPQIAESRAGEARVLGQIAFARSVSGDRRQAARIAAKALLRRPISPHALLAMFHVVTRIDPRILLASARKAGRGIT